VINVKDQEFIKAFGEQVKLLRNKKGLSQEDLAFKFDPQISTNQVGRIERGEINTSISTAKVIAKSLEVSLSELFKFDENK
jgi:ribosome-binding protein aMBF1 (putative translation factor)